MTSINIPNSVTYIDCNAFADCSKLTTLSIPNSVTTIEGGAFRNVPLVIYDGTATNYSEWDAEKVVKVTERFFTLGKVMITSTMMIDY